MNDTEEKMPGIRESLGYFLRETAKDGNKQFMFLWTIITCTIIVCSTVLLISVLTPNPEVEKIELERFKEREAQIVRMIEKGINPGLARCIVDNVTDRCM